MNVNLIIKEVVSYVVFKRDRFINIFYSGCKIYRNTQPNIFMYTLEPNIVIVLNIKRKVIISKIAYIH
jgi:hypothetical protein